MALITTMMTAHNHVCTGFKVGTQSGAFPWDGTLLPADPQQWVGALGAGCQRATMAGLGAASSLAPPAWASPENWLERGHHLPPSGA